MIKDKIKSLRKENNITQTELAEKIYVSRQTISRWENGSSIPTIDNIEQLARFFEKDISYLLPDIEQEPTKQNKPTKQITKKLKEYFLKYWIDALIFILALSPLLHIGFTPISAYSYIFARNKNKKYRTILGLILITFSTYFLVQLIHDLIVLFGIGGTTVEVIVE